MANTRTAFLNPAQHTFSPPTKRVAFNSNLRTNDGLLAHHLSSELNISYADALAHVQRFVDDSFAVLNEGGRLRIEKVGTLSFDLEQHLQFEPDNSINYLTDSFGLGSIHSPAIRRDEPAVKIRKLKGGKEKSESGRSRWRLLELVPAAAVLALLAFNPKIIPNLNSGLSSLNPFDASKNISVEEKKEEPKASDYYPETTFTETSADTIQQDTTTINPTPETSIEPLATTTAPAENKVEESTVAVNENKIAEPVSTKVETAKTLSTTDVTKKTFYVIGGCFSIYDNAVKFRDQAIADGLNAAIIGVNDKGLHMVSLFSSNSRKAARTEMEQVKQKFETGAWMYSK